MTTYVQQEKRFHPSDILGMVRRRRKAAIIMFALVLGVFLALALLLPSIYKSSATVLIEQQEIPQDLVRSTVTSFADQRIQMITQRAMTFSRLSEIIKKYDLYEKLRQREPLEQVVEKMRNDIDHQMISADVVDPRSGRPVEATIAFSISYLSHNPQTAQKVANELVSVFLEENLRSRKEKAVQAEEFLGEELGRLRGKASALEENLAAFKEDNLRSLPEQTGLNLSILDREEREYADLNRQLQVLEQQRINLKSQLAQIEPFRPVIGDGEGITLTTEGRIQYLQNRYLSLSAIYSPDHPDVIKVRRELDELLAGSTFALDRTFVERQLRILQTELDKLNVTYAPEHPAIKRHQKQIEEYQRVLATLPAESSQSTLDSADNPAYIQISASLQSVEIEISHLRESRAAVKAKIDEIEAALLNAPRVEKAYRDLTRDLENTVKKYEEVKAKQMEAQMSHALETERKGERFTLIEPPLVPERPLKPNRLLIAVMGFFAAAGMAGALVWLLEKYDLRIRSVTDVIRVTGQHPLAIVPHIGTLEEAARNRSRVWWVSLSTGCAMVMVLGLLHWMVLPLDVLFFVVMRKLG